MKTEKLLNQYKRVSVPQTCETGEKTYKAEAAQGDWEQDVNLFVKFISLFIVNIFLEWI